MRSITELWASGIAGIAVVLGILAVTIGPIITHIVWCVQHASETGSAIALLIVGLVFTPVSWVHGVCLWFGFTWI